MRRPPLNHLEHLRYRHARPEPRQEMDMVRHPAGREEDAPFAADDAAHVLIEAVAMTRANERHPALRTEDDVEDQHHIAMRHGTPLSQEVATGRLQIPWRDYQHPGAVTQGQG